MRGALISLAVVCVLVACGSEPVVDVADNATEPAPSVESESRPVPTFAPEPTATPVPLVDPTPTPEPTAEEIIYADRYPEVLGVDAAPSGDGTWTFSVTMASSYDTPQRFADGWRVLDANDNELGVRVLYHDHANEQPFTRSESIAVPAGIDRVFIEGRDMVHGWSGQRFPFVLPPR